jgi:hypothetical protein
MVINTKVLLLPLIAGAFLLALFADFSRAQPLTLVDTTWIPSNEIGTFSVGTMPTNGVSQVGEEFLVGASFLTPSTPFRLTGFELGIVNFNDSSPGSYTVSLFSESGGQPSAPLVQLATGNCFDLGETVDQILSVSDLSVDLDPNTVYYLVAGGTGYYNYLASINAYLPPESYWQFPITDGDARPWFDDLSTVYTPIYKVTGEAVPEPSTYALLALGAIGAIWFRLRRKKA